MIDYFNYMWEKTDDWIMVLQFSGSHVVCPLHANPTARRQLGLPEEGYQSRNLCAMMQERCLEIICGACSQCRQSDKPVHCTLSIPRQGGSTFWDAELTCLRIDGPKNGTILFWAKNITQTVQLSRQREELLYEYDCLFSSSINGMGLLRVDEDGLHVERANHVFQEIVEYILDCHAEPTPIQTIMSYIRSGQNHSQQFCVERSDGTRRFFKSELIVVNSEHGPHRAFVILVNATEVVRFSQRAGTRLTEREQQVLEHVVKGCTNKRIALYLGIAEGTVKKTLYNIYKKLHIQSRAEAVSYMLSTHGSASNFD